MRLGDALFPALPFGERVDEEGELSSPSVFSGGEGVFDGGLKWMTQSISEAEKKIFESAENCD